MAATADPDASPPDLRVSDQERDLVLADLREHCAQGRLTLAEMTERADHVLAARTRAELRAVTAALPAVPAAGAVEAGSRSRTRLALAVMGGEERKGRWRPARALTALALMGGNGNEAAGGVPGSLRVRVRALSLMGGKVKRRGEDR